MGGLVIGAPEYLEEDAYGPRVIETTEVRFRDLQFGISTYQQLSLAPYEIIYSSERVERVETVIVQLVADARRDFQASLPTDCSACDREANQALNIQLGKRKPSESVMAWPQGSPI